LLQPEDSPKREVAGHVSRRSGGHGKALAPPSNSAKRDGKAKEEEIFGKGKKNEDLGIENVGGGESGLVNTRRRHPLLPTRIIDIGPGEDIEPRLVCTAGWTDAPPYATLE
jgi:hypothetical protein